MPRSKLTVAFTKPRVLIGEGQDEANCFNALLGQLQVSDVQVEEYGGKGNLGMYLKEFSVRPGHQAVTALGVTCDADQSSATTFQSVSGFLSQYNLPVPNGSGQIAAGPPRIGVFILPDNQNNGFLEHLCWQAIQADPVVPCIVDYFKCVAQKAGRQPASLSKAQMRAWLASQVEAPTGIPQAKLEDFRNREGMINTLRVDSKVVHETDTGEAKSDEGRWMRFTLDTIGKTHWPVDGLGRPLFPEGFEELAKKLDRPLHPPGRDVRCIVSVGMLTEGWDCNTVTHIIGLRPFMSQLLCEQVVGRGLRRRNYEVGPGGKLTEEVAKVFGVPFEVIPFKATSQGASPPPVKRHHVHAVPAKADFEIRFPRVEGYTQAIRNRVSVDWSIVPALLLDPGRIPPEVEVKNLHVNNQGRLSLSGPGRAEDVTLAEFRAKHRIQELVFDLARTLTRDYVSQGQCTIPVQVLFPQLAEIVRHYLDDKVIAQPPADKKDLFLAPYYGWLVERLLEAIRPDTRLGEAPEIPRYEANREPGSTADVDFWTSRDVREVTHSHLNYIVADTERWEQSAAYYIDKHLAVEAFVKNSGLGFAIPYLHNGQMHDYIPDFLIRLKAATPFHLILETKGYDPLEEVKRAAAERWVAAVNADGTYGRWAYAVVKKITDINKLLDGMASQT